MTLIITMWCLKIDKQRDHKKLGKILSLPPMPFPLVVDQRRSCCLPAEAAAEHSKLLAMELGSKCLSCLSGHMFRSNSSWHFKYFFPDKYSYILMCFLFFPPKLNNLWVHTTVVKDTLPFCSSLCQQYPVRMRHATIIENCILIPLH